MNGGLSLAGCVGKYQCSPPNIVLNPEVVAPFVEVTIKGENGNTLTVGNKSYEPTNTAAITSFTYGRTDSVGVEIEVSDEEGGSFTKFFKKIIANVSEAVEKNVVRCKWGWLHSSCGGGGGQLMTTERTHTFVLKKVDLKYEQLMKFVMHCVDPLGATLDAAANEKVFGSDDQPMKLKDAITELLKTNNPGPLKYEQLRRLDGGGTAEWDWKGDPKAKWEAGQRNVLGVIKRWIRNYTTENDKGITLAWDETTDTLIAWEDSAPKCSEVKRCPRHLATFIVNGGNESPVISFNPQISFPQGAAQWTGGAADSRVSAKRRKQIDEDDECNFDDKHLPSGLVTMHASVSQDAIRNHGPDAGSKLITNDNRHMRANMMLIANVAHADLVIQGDPSMDDPRELYGATVSLIVINPFHFVGQDCPDWTHLAGSVCHQILSNQAWTILGIIHDIRKGTYTTTLKLVLQTPGSIAEKGIPLGQTPTGAKID